jgi:hypothetical protein
LITFYYNLLLLSIISTTSGDIVRDEVSKLFRRENHMAKECRAKDPNSCRVHGSHDASQDLRAVADSAATSGNVDLYLATREKMDTKKDNPSFLEQSKSITPEAIEAAARAEWDLSDADSTSWEKLGDYWKERYKNDAHGSLDAAQRYMPFGTVTDLAVEETAKYNWEYRDSKFSWEQTIEHYKEKYRLEARTALEAAAPYMPRQTNTAVRTVLGRTYDRFGFRRDTELVNDIVSVMDDPSKSVLRHEGDASPAAKYVRERLWNNYSGGGASASATADLFHALGREKELGWVVEQVPGYRYFPHYFTDYITK